MTQETLQGDAVFTRSIRSRRYLAVALVTTIALGLASRKYHGLFPAFLGKYPGDALWAQMIYWGVGLVFPSTSIARVATWALAISYVDEISQLYQEQWINEIRATTIGHLALGSAFSWYDALAYTIGVMIVAVIEVLLFRLQENRLTKSVNPGCHP